MVEHTRNNLSKARNISCLTIMNDLKYKSMLLNFFVLGISELLYQAAHLKSKVAYFNLFKFFGSKGEYSNWHKAFEKLF